VSNRHGYVADGCLRATTVDPAVDHPLLLLLAVYHEERALFVAERGWDAHGDVHVGDRSRLRNNISEKVKDFFS